MLPKSRISASRSAPSGSPHSPSEVKKIFVQDHRIHRNQLLALEAVDHEDSRARKIELGQLFRDCVEPLNRAAVIVLVMADDQPLRHSLDRGRVAGERLYFVGHLFSSGSVERRDRDRVEMGHAVRLGP